MSMNPNTTHTPGSLRVAAGIRTRAALARLCRLSAETIGRIERGGMVSTSSLAAYGAGVGVDLRTIVDAWMNATAGGAREAV